MASGSPKIIKELSLEHRWDSNARILERLAERGILISVTTLRRARTILGLRRSKAVTKPFLSEKLKQKRRDYVQWVKDNDPEWRSILFTDETALYVDQLYQAFVTRPVGSNRLDEQYIQYTFRSGIPCLMVWGAVWLGGRSPLVRFDTSASSGRRKGITAAIYRSQITEGPLLHCWRRVKSLWRGYGLPWVMEDNAPIHKAQAARGRGEELGMRYLPHPPSSPCLNPIEHRGRWDAA